MNRLSRLLIGLALALLLAAAVPGCSGSGSDSPFEGDWVSSTAPRLSFEGSSWRDGEGDAGEFSYSGEYPDYTLVFTSGGGTAERRASFLDEKTFELCSVGGGGVLFDCHEYVIDRPTIH